MKIKVDNMKQQHSTIVGVEHTTPHEEPKERKEYAIISVCAGEGLKAIFEEMGCDYVISGGQTMNPSIEDFVTAIETLNAKILSYYRTIVILLWQRIKRLKSSRIVKFE